MNAVLEISSDSNDSNKSLQDANSVSEMNLILQKYGLNDFGNSKSNDDLDLNFKLSGQSKTEFTRPTITKLVQTDKNSEEYDFNLDDVSGGTTESISKLTAECDNLLKEFSEKYKKLNDYNSTDNSHQEKTVTDISSANSSKKTTKLDREAARLQKQEEREKKKEEMEKQKQLKIALKEVEKTVKPDECMKFLTVNIDNDILELDYGPVIISGLQTNGISYKIENQLIPNVISWTRNIPTIENMLLNSSQVLEKHYLLLMNLQSFLSYIENNTLLSHIQTLFSIIDVKQLTLAVYNLEKYYVYLKFLKNNDLRNDIKDKFKEFKNLPNLPKKKIEYALAELQLFHPSYIRAVEKPEDVCALVLECTKAVSQIPYKLQKQEKYNQQTEYFAGVNKDCVRVDKNGNGLNRLWNQALTMFPMARLETAEAISAVYPTPYALFQAYKQCKNQKDAEKLLENIPIRRAAGPLASVRRIGPELSKKAYTFFCSQDNILL